MKKELSQQILKNLDTILSYMNIGVKFLYLQDKT